MKNSLLLLATVLLLASCKDKEKSSAKKDKDPVSSEYLITKEGIGELKIGMFQADIEKLLKQSLVMKHTKDTGEVWSDTATVTYNKMEVTLYFQKSYLEAHPEEMELFGLSTNSTLCKTATGLGVGDDRNAILAAYEDNPINMGPESVMVNDSTWALSKTNYYINVSDDKWDKQIIFQLINKKVATIQASLAMGE